MATKDILVLHFNDVYNVEPGGAKDPNAVVAGAARFMAKVRSFEAEKPLILFSGDAINPSSLSTITKGVHMAPVLNEISPHVAVAGNHDFDFGLDAYLDVRDRTKFPWLLSNYYDRATGKPFAGSPATFTLEHQGIKFGFMGLCEEDWMATLGAVDPSTIEYKDMITEGKKLSEQLKGEGCQVIVALTHSRLPNDELVAEELAGYVHMVCGGHDHDYVVKQMPKGVWIVKSGTDFRQLTECRITVPDAPGFASSFNLTWKRHDIIYSIPEDPAMKAIIDEYLAAREKSMAVPIGLVECQLDARFSSVRTRETNIGNLVCDQIREVLKCDAVLINGGSLRADAIQGPGEYTVKMLVDLLPMPSSCCLLEMPGKLLFPILENSVAKYPVLEGRFGQVSGIKFAFDPDQPAGKRVLHDSVEVAGAPLDPERRYKVATTAYLSGGKDGYDAFKDPSVKLLVDEEDGPVIPTVMRNYFRVKHVLKKMGVGAKAENKAAAMLMAKSRKLQAQKSGEEYDEDGDQTSLDIATIAPRLEGRIRNIKEQPQPTPKSPKPEAAEAKAAEPSGPKVVANPADYSLVFVLGAPGSGKGTQCERIAKKYGYKHLSTGDLLRDEVKSGSALGKELDKVMQSGGLVSSATVLTLLRNGMTEGGKKTKIEGKFLIDGYPRAMDQIESFESSICKPSFVLAFDAAEKVLEERLVNRGKTSGRADDNVESIRKRFATFKAQSEPVITHYAKSGLVKALNSERPVDDVWVDVDKIFATEVGRLTGQATTERGGLVVKTGGAKTTAALAPTSSESANSTPAHGAPSGDKTGAVEAAKPAAAGGCCTVM